MEDLAVQIKTVFDSTYQIGILLLLTVLFKDFIQDLARNLFYFIQIRLDKKIYSSEGSIILINGEEYVIINIGFSKVFLRNLKNNNYLKLPISRYWKGDLCYKNIENLYSNLKKQKD